MHVFLTGGAGYIGSKTTAALLAAGAQVTVFDSLLYGGDALIGLLDHPSFRLVRGDVRDPDALRAAMQGCDAVVHLAAVVGEPACALDEEAAMATNLHGTENVLRAFTELGVSRLVFLSTCSNYGVAAPGVLADEDSPLNPLSQYSRSKVAAESLVRNHEARGCAVVLRFGTICGLSARMRFDLLVNEMARCAARKERIEVYAPEAWRPYLHIRDAAAAIAHCLVAPPERIDRRVFNVIGENCTKRALVDLVRTHFPDTPIEIKNGKRDPRDYRVDGSRVNRELGFVPRTTVAQALLEVAAAVSKGIFRNPLWQGHSALPDDPAVLRRVVTTVVGADTPGQSRQAA